MVLSFILLRAFLISLHFSCVFFFLKCSGFFGGVPGFLEAFWVFWGVFQVFWKRSGFFWGVPGFLEAFWVFWGVFQVFWKRSGFFGGVPGFLEAFWVFWGCSWFFGCSGMFRGVPAFQCSVFRSSCKYYMPLIQKNASTTLAKSCNCLVNRLASY